MKLAFCLALLCGQSAIADFKYDYKTGNSYTTTKDDDSTSTRGYNMKTGSTWSSKTDNDTGKTTGTDSNGNYYNYDPNTGNYSNTSGKMCTGKGAGRICTGN